MSYLNNSHSLNYSLEGQDSTQSQIEFLKLKLIETHTKFIKQLQLTKDLEFKIAQYQQEQSFLKRQNEDLRRKIQHNQHERVSNDKLKHMQNILAESEKKNDLLRNDLEIMRTKTMELVAKNQQLDRQNRNYDQNHQKIHDKLNHLASQLKLKQMNAQQYRQEAQRYRIKYQKQVTNNQEAEQEIQDLKRQKTQVEKQYEHLENSYSVQKEKHNKQFQEILMLQKQNKEWKNKVENMYEENNKMKNELYELKARTKAEERNLANDLQRLTQDYNNLQGILKQKQFEIQSARRRPLEQVSRKKKNTFQQTKQLVGKLERQQQIVSRGSPTKDRLSPSKYTHTANITKTQSKPQNRTYKEEKQEYLSIIESVGTMEGQMLAYNLEKKKILAQIDKIDETRVKTKDMISRRRRLQVQLQNQQRKLDHVKGQLKRMKVM